VLCMHAHGPAQRAAGILHGGSSQLIANFSRNVYQQTLLPVKVPGQHLLTALNPACKTACHLLYMVVLYGQSPGGWQQCLISALQGRSRQLYSRMTGNLHKAKGSCHDSRDSRPGVASNSIHLLTGLSMLLA
jgi:hypothetical protein